MWYLIANNSIPEVVLGTKEQTTRFVSASGRTIERSCACGVSWIAEEHEIGEEKNNPPSLNKKGKKCVDETH